MASWKWCLILPVVLGLLQHTVSAADLDSEQFGNYMVLEDGQERPSREFHSSEKVAADYFNNLVDSTLETVKTNIGHAKFHKLNLPDITETFHHNGIFTDVKGHFKAWDGWLVNLNTLRRTDVVKVSVQGNKYRFVILSTMDIFKFGFNHYEAKFMDVGPSGKISGSVRENEIELTLLLEVDNDHQCFITAERVRLSELTGVSVDVTGIWPLNWLVGKVTGWITTLLKNIIFGQWAVAVAQDVLDNLECDQHMIQQLAGFHPQ